VILVFKDKWQNSLIRVLNDPAEKARWDLANKKMERKAGKLLMIKITHSNY
jgi:hypothetical protein